MRQSNSAETYLVKGPEMVPHRDRNVDQLCGYAIEAKGLRLNEFQIALLCRLLEQTCTIEREPNLCMFNPRFAVHFQQSTIGIVMLYCPGCKETAFCRTGEPSPVAGSPMFSLCAIDSVEGFLYGIFPSER